MSVEQILESIQSLNNDDFVKLINQLEAQREKRAQEILSSAQAQVSALTGAESAAPKRKRRAAVSKYVDPQSGKTWTGQGRQPKWFADYLERGGRKEDLVIR